MKNARVRQDSVDILKAGCAFLVVWIHCGFPGRVGAWVETLSSAAVPIFFMITGFYSSENISRDVRRRQIVKALTLLIEANLIFLGWKLWYTAHVGKSVTNYLRTVLSAPRILRFIVLNESPFSRHLWYLGAILYVLIIVAAAERMRCRRLLDALTPILLAGDLILGKYSVVLFHQKISYLFARNFLFVGIPYFCIGGMIQRGLGRQLGRRRLMGIAVLSAGMMLLERAILNRVGMNAARNHYISTTVLVLALFLLALSYSGHAACGTARLAAAIGRKYSTWLYILHPMISSLITLQTKRLGCYPQYRYIAPMIVYAATLLCLMLIQTIGARLVRRWRG